MVLQQGGFQGGALTDSSLFRPVHVHVTEANRGWWGLNPFATVVVIEHNLDIIAEADYLIELGPEAGENGGEITFAGAPEAILKVKESRTGPFLEGMLGGKPKRT